MYIEVLGGGATFTLHNIAVVTSADLKFAFL